MRVVPFKPPVPPPASDLARAMHACLGLLAEEAEAGGLGESASAMRLVQVVLMREGRLAGAGLRRIAGD